MVVVNAYIYDHWNQTCVDCLQSFNKLDAFKAALKEASQSSDSLNVLFVETGANAGALNFFGLKNEDTPAFAIHDQAKNAKYLMKGVKPSDTAKFIKDFGVRAC